MSRSRSASSSGKVLLVVNTASECGYTPQYEGLEKLYRRYRDKGFAVLGFPANDFGGQEPGSNKQIAQFCQLNYGVTFPMFAKTSVVGANANPLFHELAARTGKPPRWNFHKYLLDKAGQPVAVFESAVEPADPLADFADRETADPCALTHPSSRYRSDCELRKFMRAYGVKGFPRLEFF